jgi:hypothetical protein
VAFEEMDKVVERQSSECGSRIQEIMYRNEHSRLLRWSGLFSPRVLTGDSENPDCLTVMYTQSGRV